MTNDLILIVEDNERNRRLVRDVLQFKGYRTLESETGEEGVRLAREQQPALVIMDCHLPGMSGIEALKVLRADPATSSIPVIAVTGSVMTASSQQLLAAGFDAFQDKPIHIATFIEAVEQALKKTASPA